jgi:hypothetical protein
MVTQTKFSTDLWTSLLSDTMLHKCEPTHIFAHTEGAATIVMKTLGTTVKYAVTWYLCTPGTVYFSD